jgi:hypothetical protein
MVMTRSKVEEFCEDSFPGVEILLADGFDEAFIGVGSQFSNEPVAVYDRDKCIEVLMKRDEMTYEDAVEYFDFNVQGAWVGEKTPIFVECKQ